MITSELETNVLLIPHKSHENTKVFKGPKISLDTNLKHINIKHKFSKNQSIRKKRIGLGIVDIRLTY